MLRNFSHELKTPLATIREGVELLNDRVPGTLSDEQAEVIGIVRANSLKLQTLIENLIRLNVAQGEEISMSWQSVGLCGLLDEVLDEQRLLAESRGLRMQRTFDTATVPGDRDKLKAVFQNVVSNAIKYSPEGGAVDITLRRDTDRAIVDVIDQGPGVDPAERDKVFELFYRGRQRVAGRIKGSGVGLAIAQAYVRLHKGSIEIVDVPRGAHLRVALPLAAE
jgi:two-component system sensor histidine kinase GlrK